MIKINVKVVHGSRRLSRPTLEEGNAWTCLEFFTKLKVRSQDTAVALKAMVERKAEDRGEEETVIVSYMADRHQSFIWSNIVSTK